jgi:hypothetical protein
VKDAAHVDLYTFAKDEYEQRVDAFLSKYLRRTSEPGITGDTVAVAALTVSHAGQGPGS